MGASLADTSRYRLTSAMRQTLATPARRRYLRSNPAVDARLEWLDGLDAAGVAGAAPYDLRHTFATQAFAAGKSIGNSLA